MADRYKILGLNSISAGASLAELYSVPEAAAKTVASAAVEVSPKAVSILVQALVVSIIVCNKDATAAGTFEIQLEAAADDTADTYLFKANPLAEASTKVLSLALTLSPGDKISGTCAAVDCDFTVMGIEITGGRGPDA